MLALPRPAAGGELLNREVRAALDNAEVIAQAWSIRAWTRQAAHQPITSNPGSPDSAIVGTSGNRDRALQAPARERAQLSRFRVRHAHGDRSEGHLHFVRELRCDRRRDAL